MWPDCENEALIDVKLAQYLPPAMEAEAAKPLSRRTAKVLLKSVIEREKNVKIVTSGLVGRTWPTSESSH